MGILDVVSKFVGGQASGAGGDHAAVAGALMEQLDGAGGVGGLIQSFHQNGAGSLIQQFAGGQTGAADPNAIEQALGGTGLIDGIAQKTGMSSDTVKSSLATVLPMLVHHSISNGHVTADGQAGDIPAPDAGSLLTSVLGKLV